MKTKRNRSGGFTLIEIMIVVAIIGLLASIAVPNFTKARGMARQKACISNLQAIDGAIETWATDMNKAEGQPVTYSDIRTFLKSPPVCPSGGTTFDDSYTITTVGAQPVCQRLPTGPNAHALPQMQ
ncbi:MAG TPA: type II secretion system protein [Dongiaceae bacterium]|nr:type II secretion system protein [Dongiaceae bacterium]